MKKSLILVLVALMVVAVLSFTAGAKTVSELTAEYSKSINHTNSMELKMNLDMGEKYIIIDVRTPEEFAAGHIPGAINVDFGMLFFQITKYVPQQDAEFIIYCRSGGRSVIATKIVAELGYKNVINLQGGFMDWAKAGYLVETKHGLFKLDKWEEK